MQMPQAVSIPPMLAVTIEANGRTQIACQIPKLEAVKMLLSVVEELRMQAYQEKDRLIQAPATNFDARVDRIV